MGSEPRVLLVFTQLKFYPFTSRNLSYKSETLQHTTPILLLKMDAYIPFAREFPSTVLIKLIMLLLNFFIVSARNIILDFLFLSVIDSEIHKGSLEASVSYKTPIKRTRLLCRTEAHFFLFFFLFFRLPLFFF